MLQLRLLFKTVEYEEWLQEWAKRLNVSIDILLVLIIEAMAEGSKFVEKSPDWIVTPD